MRTTGVSFETFKFNDTNFDIYDAGGQRSERKKWINAFVGVNAVLYVAALDHYATVLFEDEQTNAMIESLNIFYEILNSKWFLRTDVMLFLNKEDLFNECILDDAPLSSCFNANNGCVFKPSSFSDNKNNKNQTHMSYASYQKLIYNRNNTKNNELSAGHALHNQSDQIKKQESLPSGSETSEQMEIALINTHVKQDDLKKENIEKCEIYPNTDLKYSTKRTYCNGAYANMSDDDWFSFVKMEYLCFIIKEYQSKNLMPKRYLHVHITTATHKDAMTKLFMDVQTIIIKKNLTKGGIF